jgi:hypothetical protein
MIPWSPFNKEAIVAKRAKQQQQQINKQKSADVVVSQLYG